MAVKIGGEGAPRSTVETWTTFLRRCNSPLAETDVGKSAAVVFTDVSCLKVELAEVGQTAAVLRITQLQAVEKTSEVAPSRQPLHLHDN